MVKTIRAYPKNKDKVIKLTKFAKQIIKILEGIGAKPIVYGSLAVFIHSQKEDFLVNDMDFYIKEKFFDKLIEVLKKKKIRYKNLKNHHSIQIFKDRLKIEVDSHDFWGRGKGLSKKVDFNGITLNVLNFQELLETYKYASHESNHTGKNKVKYEILKKTK